MEAKSTQILRAGTISFWGALAISFGNMAPAAGVIFTPQAMAQFTGTGVPLAFLLSMIAAFFTASSLIYFARRFSSAGSSYAFLSLAFNKMTGFLSGWLTFFAYGLSFPANMLVFGYFGSGLLTQAVGIHVPWAILSLIAMAIILWMVIRGLKVSARVDLVLIIVESLIVFTLALIIIIHGGAQGNTLAVFSPKRAHGGMIGILFGMLYGVGAFAGFEASITVAEEARDRYRTIPAAILVAVLLGGLLYVVVSYAIAIGYGVHGGAQLAQATLPLSVLAKHYVGNWMVIAIDVAGMVSSFGVSLAASNAGSRIMYAMGRDKVIFPWFGQLHPRFDTPRNAMWTLTLATAALVLGLGIPANPYPVAFSYITAAAGLVALSIYVLANIGWMRLWWKEQNHFEMGWMKALVPPSLGALIMFVPLVTSLVPIPSWPFNLITYLTILYAVIGVMIAWHIKLKDPDQFSQLGHMFSSIDG
ncbi:MAG: APC family permease [Acidibacillus sp.]|nr:APC family permease [Acidibacillus sp.]